MPLAEPAGASHPVTVTRPRVVVVDDCVEFRMLQIACGTRTADEWFETFLAPEGISREEYVDALVAIGRPWDVVLAPDEPGLRAELERADVVVVERHRVDGQLLSAAPNLRAVVVYGASLQFVDGDACAARGVSVHCVRRRTTANVADHVMMLMLALSRRLAAGARVTAMQGTATSVAASTEQGGHPPTLFNWVGAPGIDALAGRRLVVIGAGAIGVEVLRRARAFDMVLGYSSRRAVRWIEEELGARRLDIGEAAAWADVISLHVPYSRQLHHLVDRRFIDDLGLDGLLINTSRGLLVDTDVLVDALHEGRLAGAGLDVFDVEPLPPGHPLLTAPNTILTPHVGAGTRWHLVTDVARTIEAVDAGLETPAP